MIQRPSALFPSSNVGETLIGWAGALIRGLQVCVTSTLTNARVAVTAVTSILWTP